MTLPKGRFTKNLMNVLLVGSSFRLRRNCGARQQCVRIGNTVLGYLSIENSM